MGADYSAIDVVDAKVPHGLYDPEISFVAMPGVPETTVHVLETLKQGQVNSNGVEKLEEKDLENLAGKVAFPYRFYNEPLLASKYALKK